jgi:hypothetical protein
LFHLPPQSDSTVTEDAGIELRTIAKLCCRAKRSLLTLNILCNIV